MIYLLNVLSLDDDAQMKAAAAAKKRKIAAMKEKHREEEEDGYLGSGKSYHSLSFHAVHTLSPPDLDLESEDDGTEVVLPKSGMVSTFAECPSAVLISSTDPVC